MINPLGSKEQIETLKQFVEIQKSLFDVSTGVRGRYVLSGYKKTPDYSRFSIEVWAYKTKIGFVLKGPPIKGIGKDRNVLIFSTFSSKSDRQSGLLASNGQEINLYHSGKVTSGDGRASPFREDGTVDIKGKNYYCLGQIFSKSIFESIMEFHISRLDEEDLKQSGLQNKKGFDPGPSVGGPRTGVVLSIPRHNPIALALHAIIVNQRNFEEVNNCQSKPDLLVMKGKQKIIFEIKPYGYAHDLIIACGQLLVYNEDANATHLIIVTDELKLKNNSAIHRFIERNNIKIVYYKIEGNEIKFPNLLGVIDKNQSTVGEII